MRILHIAISIFATLLLSDCAVFPRGSLSDPGNDLYFVDVLRAHRDLAVEGGTNRSYFQAPNDVSVAHTSRGLIPFKVCKGDSLGQLNRGAVKLEQWSLPILAVMPAQGVGNTASAISVLGTLSAIKGAAAFSDNARNSLTEDGDEDIEAVISTLFPTQSQMTATKQCKSEVLIDRKVLEKLSLYSFLSDYVGAYFRHGHVLSFSLNADGFLEDLVKKAKPGCEKQFTDPADVKTCIDAFSESVTTAMKTLCSKGGTAKCEIWSNLDSEAGFVPRIGGGKMQFTPIDVVFDSNSSDWTLNNRPSKPAVFSDLARVIIEAIYDWKLSIELPGQKLAAKGATACKRLLPCFDDDFKKQELQKLLTRVNRAEAIGRLAAGYAVRGGYWFSLNNEAAALTLESTLASLTRKSWEYLDWKKYFGNHRETTALVPIKIAN